MKLASISTLAVIVSAGAADALTWRSNRNATLSVDRVNFDAGLFSVAVVEQPASCGVVMIDSPQFQWTQKRLVKRAWDTIDEEKEWPPSASDSSKALLTSSKSSSESLSIEKDAHAKLAEEAVSSPRKGRSMMERFFAPLKTAAKCVGDVCAQMALADPQYYGLAEAHLARHHGYSPTAYPPRRVQHQYNSLEEQERLELEEATRRSLREQYLADSPTLRSSESIKIREGQKGLGNDAVEIKTKGKGLYEPKPVKVREHHWSRKSANGGRLFAGSSSKDVVEQDWMEEDLRRKQEHLRIKKELERIEQEKERASHHTQPPPVSETSGARMWQTTRQALRRSSRLQTLARGFRSEPGSPAAPGLAVQKQPSGPSSRLAHPHVSKRSTSRQLVKRAAIPMVLSSEEEISMKKRNGGVVHAHLAEIAKSNPKVAQYVAYQYGSKPIYVKPSVLVQEHLTAALHGHASASAHGSSPSTGHRKEEKEHGAHKPKEQEHEDHEDFELNQDDFPMPPKNTALPLKDRRKLDHLRSNGKLSDRYNDLAKHPSLPQLHPEGGPLNANKDAYLDSLSTPQEVDARRAAAKSEVSRIADGYDAWHMEKFPWKIADDHHHDNSKVEDRNDKIDHFQNKPDGHTRPVLKKSHSFSGRIGGPVIKKDDSEGPAVLKKPATFKKDEWGSMVDHLVNKVTHSKKPDQ